MSETVTRAITFSVSHVHDGGTWDEFQKMLHELWRCSTEASNWAMQYYARTDNLGEAGATLPPCPKLYAYPHLSAHFPGLSSGVCATIGRNTERDYRRHRAQFWRGGRSLPLYRYPAPYPLRKQDWKPCLVHGERPGVCFSTGSKKGGGTRRWTLVLSGGPGFSRQLAQFRQIVAGTAAPCDLAIYRQRAGETHRNQTSGKAPGGASKVQYRVMLKIVAKFPVAERGPADGTLVLKTDPAALWVACHDGRVVSPWVLNADDARQWLARMRDAHADHAARLQRMAQDLKTERRTHVGAYAQHRGKLDAMCDKHRRRVGTFLKQCAAGIVNYCVRRKVHSLIYDDTDRSWMPKFPWAMLRTELRNRCEQSGVQAGGTLLLAEEEAEEVVEQGVASATEQ
jgi:hypothetical protein